MVELGKLVADELGDNPCVDVNPNELLKKAREIHFDRLSGTLIGNSIGVCTYIPEEKREKIEAIADIFVRVTEGWYAASQQEQELYDTLKHMAPGMLRKLHWEGEEYLLATFQEEIPVSGLILFC